MKKLERKRERVLAALKSAVEDTAMSLRHLRRFGIPGEHNEKSDHEYFSKLLVELFDLDEAQEQLEIQLDRIDDKLAGRPTDEDLDAAEG